MRVAVGRDYQDVAPTRGVLLGGGERQLEVEVRMRPYGASAGKSRTGFNPRPVLGEESALSKVEACVEKIH